MNTRNAIVVALTLAWNIAAALVIKDFVLYSLVAGVGNLVIGVLTGIWLPVRRNGWNG